MCAINVDKYEPIKKALYIKEHRTKMGILTSLFKKQPKTLKLDPSKKIDCPTVTVIYGTKTGNAQLVAQHLQKTFIQNNIDTECINMGKYNIERIFSEKLLLIVISTDGEGELPPNSRKFYKALNNELFPSLNKLNYAICALGDSSYEFFCGAGKMIEERLSELGANALLPRVDCDVDFKDTAIAWIEQIYSHLSENSTSAPAPLDTYASINMNMPAMHHSTLKERKILTKGDKENATYHVVLDNETNHIQYQSGDCIEIIPENPEQLVVNIINTLNIDTNVTINGSGHAIYHLLKYKYELTKLTRKVVRSYQSTTAHAKLIELVDNKEALTKYIATKDVLDLLLDYPSTVTGEQLIKILMPLHTRYYSIASGYRATPNQIDLTIKTIRIENEQRQYEGAASVYLNESLKEGTKVHFRLVPNSSFYLPEQNDLPIILIGVGTGIAPYRGFLQDRKDLNIKNKTWLIWGSKKQRHDFLYEEELKLYLQDDYLARMDVCFSRDQEAKVYVQDLIKENQKTIAEWIKNGAHIYLCGHTQMGHDVRDTLSEILMETKKISKQEANEDIISMRENGIIHEDLY